MSNHNESYSNIQPIDESHATIEYAPKAKVDRFSVNEKDERTSESRIS